MGREIYKEVEEFLGYLIEVGRDQQKRSWEFLKRKLGKKKYERMYDFCVERGYTSSLPFKNGKKKDLHIYVKPNGFAFLEEQRRRDLQQTQIRTQNVLTFGIFTVAFLQGILLLIYYFFDLRIRGENFYAGSYLAAGLILLAAIAIVLVSITSKK